MPCCSPLVTEDKVEIAYEHFKNGFDSLIIVCPGFFNSKKNNGIRKAGDVLGP